MQFVLSVEVVCVQSHCCQSSEPSASEEHASVNTTVQFLTEICLSQEKINFLQFPLS